jgi:Ca2+-binding RTX toxin-like protein
MEEICMATQQQVIKKFMQTLNDTDLKGGKALDAAIKASNSKFKNFEAVRKQFLKDIKNAKSWHRFLVEKCGIVLDNKDTGAITGSDAGGSTAKGATDLLPSTGDAKYPEGSSFTVDGLTIYGIPDKSKLTADQQYVVQGLYSWWIRDALALIKESYGLSYTDEGTTNARLQMKFIDNPDESSYAYVSYNNIDGDEEKVYESRVLCVNMAMFKNMDPGNRHGSTSKVALDRVLAHELVHGVMASNVNYFSSLPDFLSEGGTAELVHGLDDENYDDMVEYAQDPETFEEILTTKQFDGESPYGIYPGGYIFMRYFAKQASGYKSSYDTYKKTVKVDSLNFATNYWDTVNMNGGDGNDTITNSGSTVIITAGKGDDVIKTYSSKVTVNAGDGNDYVLNDNWKNKVSISGGAGNDTIDNKCDSSKVSGGAGNDSIENYGDTVKVSGDADNDYIKNEGAKSSILGGAGNDTIFNEVSVEKGKKLSDNTIAENGATILAEDDKNYLAKLSGGGNSTIWGGAGSDNITNNASKVVINGDEEADFITNNGFGVTVNGGKGNDSIVNDSLSFTIDDGKVTISGYKAKLNGDDGDDFIRNTVGEAQITTKGGYLKHKDSIAAVQIYGGAGNDSIENEGAKVSVYGGAGEDVIFNLGDYSTVYGGDDSDLIYNYGENAVLSGDAGNDTIYSCGEAAMVSGEDGDDFILNEGVDTNIYGDAGNDTINNEGDHIMISGGAGNDSITNTGKHITYRFGKGDGKDTVVGFNANDTVQIWEGKYSAKKSGNDVVVTIGKDTLTLKDAVGKQINFVDDDEEVIETKTFKKKAAKTSSAKVSAKVSSHWFDETNFDTSDNLSSIVQSKDISSSYSVGDLDSSTSLTKKDNLVTYSSSKK